MAVGSPSKQDFAERLGQWLHVPNAIELYAALNANPEGVARAGAGGDTTEARAAIGDEVARTRLALAAAIARSCAADAAKERLTFPPLQASATPADGGATDFSFDYSFVPFHRFYLAHQRDMESRITPLRARLREALHKSTPAMQSLATLDAVFEKSLRAREYNLLATVPTLLEQRFAQLLAEYRQAIVDTATADTAPANGATPWLLRFRDEMQQVLLAELDLRFEPITGLLAALQAAHEARPTVIPTSLP